MALVKYYRGRDANDKQPVFGFTYRLPDGKVGLVVFNEAEVLGIPVDITTAATDTLINRCDGYLNSINFLTDLLNDQHYDMADPHVSKWVDDSFELYLQADVALFGIDESM